MTSRYAGLMNNLMTVLLFSQRVHVKKNEKKTVTIWYR